MIKHRETIFLFLIVIKLQINVIVAGFFIYRFAMIKINKIDLMH